MVLYNSKFTFKWFVLMLFFRLCTYFVWWIVNLVVDCYWETRMCGFPVLAEGADILLKLCHWDARWIQHSYQMKNYFNTDGNNRCQGKYVDHRVVRPLRFLWGDLLHRLWLDWAGTNLALTSRRGVLMLDIEDGWYMILWFTVRNKGLSFTRFLITSSKATTTPV